MKLIYYSLILLIIVSIVLLSCKTQNSPPVGVHSGGVFPERIMGEEVKSIDELLDTFNLSEDQREAAEYLRKALVDDAKTYSNNTFHDFLSQLGADQVKEMMDNISEHRSFMSESQASIDGIQDPNVKDNLQDRLLRAIEEYLRLLKDYYSDISVSVQERYARLSDPSNGANLQSISNDAEAAELIHELHNIASSDEINRIFNAHNAPEPGDMYGMQKVFKAFTGVIDYLSSDESRVKRRGLIYLAFDYKHEDLKFVGEILSKYVIFSEDDEDVLYYGLRIEHLKRVFEILERFSQLYYLSSFKNLKDKEANLDKLELEDLSTLKQQFVLLEIEKQKLVAIKNQIITDGYEATLNSVVKEVEKANNAIIAILNKI
ncbi:BTA121 domain-containing protein surface lipoprotein [Borrelia persica]|uniref:BTA121 domain-containing protein surface lipoprotein n=1 Tax=Borrelia persica TaxID=44448 RepID=UPI0004666C88|nr:CRASP family complement regulator-acquiring lipoprotein [Borrelia persica]